MELTINKSPEFMKLVAEELARTPEPDIAGIIAGELQTSRAHAYELMERALKERKE